MTKIKICGLFRPEDILYVNLARPDFCGFIIDFKPSHRSLSPAQVRTLRAGLCSGITPVGVFVDRAPDVVAALLNEGTIDIAQLHGHEDEAYMADLRRRAPGHEIWKAFKVRSAEDLAAVNRSSADMVLPDNGYGTGKTFDWALARGVNRPYILAGGLTSENIPDAIARLHPYGLDISSGVETDQKKDLRKMLAAVAAARKEGAPCQADALASTAGSTSPKR